jgi:radical SAM protein with 4Fe4S-binding SPASM domain
MDFNLSEKLINMKKKQFKLKEVCLEITDICPMACLHCSGSCGIRGKYQLTLEQIKKIINDINNLNGKVLEISGGEPLMHPHLIEIINYATKKDLECVLYTSGVIMNKDGRRIPMNLEFAKKLRDVGLTKVVFSLHGATQWTHEYISQVSGSFEKIIDSIKIVRSLDFWIGVHFVPMKPNYKEFEEVVRLSYELGVDKVDLLRFVPQGRGAENRSILELSKGELKEFMETVIRLQSIYKDFINVGCSIDFRHLLLPSAARDVCGAGIWKCTITPSGNVVPCPAFKQNTKYVAGNINTRSLANIWHSPLTWQDIRNFDYMQLNEPCKSCIFLHQCRGGCNAQRALHYGSVYAAPDPGCFKFLSNEKG